MSATPVHAQSTAPSPPLFEDRAAAYHAFVLGRSLEGAGDIDGAGFELGPNLLCIPTSEKPLHPFDEVFRRLPRGQRDHPFGVLLDPLQKTQSRQLAQGGKVPHHQSRYAFVRGVARAEDGALQGLALDRGQVDVSCGGQGSSLETVRGQECRRRCALGLGPTNYLNTKNDLPRLTGQVVD